MVLPSVNVLRQNASREHLSLPLNPQQGLEPLGGALPVDRDLGLGDGGTELGRRLTSTTPNGNTAGRWLPKPQVSGAELEAFWKLLFPSLGAGEDSREL